MTDEPMTDGGKRVVPQEPGIVTRLLSVKDAKPHYARVHFSAVDPLKHPPRPGWRSLHGSRSAAHEFARSLEADPNPTGSPKQYRARLARIRKLPLELLDHYTHHVTIEEVPQDDQRAIHVPGAFKRRVKPGDPGPTSSGPVSSGPAQSHGDGPDLLGAVLSDEEIAIRDRGEEAQGSPGVEGPEAGQDRVEVATGRPPERDDRATQSGPDFVSADGDDD